MKNPNGDYGVKRCKCGMIPRVLLDGDALKVVCSKCGRTTGWLSPRREAMAYWDYIANKKEGGEK